MNPLPATHGKDMLAAIAQAEQAVSLGIRDFSRDRMVYVSATIGVADQIAFIDNLIRLHGDPADVEGTLLQLKSRLEELEDLIFNPQDKPELLQAIRERPNALTQDMMATYRESQAALAEAKAQLNKFEAFARSTRLRVRILTIVLIAAIAALAAMVIGVWMMRAPLPLV